VAEDGVRAHAKESRRPFDPDRGPPQGLPERNKIFHFDSNKGEDLSAGLLGTGAGKPLELYLTCLSCASEFMAAEPGRRAYRRWIGLMRLIAAESFFETR
jgi:hypothetical protein